MKPIRLLSISAVVMIGLASQVRAQSAGFGAIGDSYADEYQFYPPDRSSARNFVEILSAAGGLNFGDFTTTDRGDVRHQGYAYDYALDGAATSDLGPQVTGLASQIAAGKVQYALAFVGGNDFLDALVAGDPTALPGVVQTALTNVTTSVSELEAAGNVKVVVATLPDLELLPIAQQFIAAGFLPKAFADAASQAEQTYNADLKAAFAKDPNVAIDDFATQIATTFSSGAPVVGGVSLVYPETGDHYYDAFLADGLHPGTIVQGLLADSFINTLDTSFNAGITPLTPAQIAEFAKSVDPAVVPLPAAWKMFGLTAPLMIGLGAILKRKTARN